MSRDRQPLQSVRIARALVLACAVLAVGVFAWRARSPDARLVVPGPDAPWVMVDVPVTARLQQWGRAEAPPVRFVASFEAAEPGPAELELRAFGRARVWLNEREILSLATPDGVADGRAPRRASVEDAVIQGGNQILVEVRNRVGPPLLALRLVVPGGVLQTDPGWRAVTEDGALHPVRMADDTRRHPSAFAGERPLDALTHRAPVLLLLALLGAAGFAAVAREGRSPPPAGAVFAVLAGLWVLLFVTRFLAIPLDAGFDAANHLDYLVVLEKEGRLPLAADHWSTYHPPLFYLVAGALGGFRPPTGQPFAWKLVPFASGLALVGISGLLARRLLPERPEAPAHAMLFTAVLPVNLVMAAYVSNEGLHAALAATCVWLAVTAILDAEPPVWRLGLLSFVSGLALLTKFTAMLIVIPALVAAALATLPGRANGKMARRGAALLLPALLVSGWWYARNAAIYGRPWLGNWELPGATQTWWSPPGFHTPAYYLGFGEALVRPFFSGFVSVWDALYSTLWGDGFLGGVATVTARREIWNYEWMAAGYLLALPITALVAVGGLRLGLRAWRAHAPRHAAAVALVLLGAAALAYAVVLLTLMLPYHGQARASYLLAAAPALALAWAEAWTALDRALAARGAGTWRAALHGVWIATAGCFLLGIAG